MDSNQAPKMGTPQQYCLKWNNHSANFITVFDQLYRSESFTDVTLSLEGGKSIKCHKMVLAACSSYFRNIFQQSTEQKVVVILNGVKYGELVAILDYMYRGEVKIVHDQLDGLLKAAELLKVKGLVGEDEFKNVKEEAEPSTSSPQAITTSTTSSAAHSSGYISPTHNNATSPYNMHYGQSPVDRNPVHMLQWAAFPGLLMPQHPISGHQPPPRNSIRGSSYENSAETSPLSRKKLLANRVDTPILRNVLGQGQADSSQGASGHLDSSRQEGSFCSNSNGSLHDSDRRNSAELSESMMDEDEKRISPHHNYREKTGHKSGPKPEWKRYKQYTREDIQEAMLAVSNKEMSALQAARKHGVPSRTLYDKLKKAGILPSRGAALRRESTTSLHCGGSARFPYSAASVNGSIYGSHNALSDHSEGEQPPTNGSAYPHDDHNHHHDHHHLVMDMSTRSPSPTRLDDDEEDQVEDLSIGRTSAASAAPAAPQVISADVKLVVPAARAMSVKDEEPEDSDTSNRV